MRTIKIAKPFQELFGKEITRLELMLTLFLGVILSALLLSATFEEWRNIPLWRQVLLFILTLDLAGGVIGNFSFSTNHYYKTDPKSRLLFILMNIQPVILAYLLNNAYAISIIETAYTLVAALIVNALISHPAQRAIGATFMVLGIAVLMLLTKGVPVLLLSLMALHIFKIVFSFAVDHFAERKNNERAKEKHSRKALMAG